MEDKDIYTAIGALSKQMEIHAEFHRDTLQEVKALRQEVTQLVPVHKKVDELEDKVNSLYIFKHRAYGLAAGMALMISLGWELLKSLFH